MIDFLKRFGLGVVYVLASPFLLAFLILWTLYTFIIFIIGIFKGIKNFFKGGKFFVEFKEDIDAKKILSLNATNREPTSLNNPTIEATLPTFDELNNTRNNQ